MIGRTLVVLGLTLGLGAAQAGVSVGGGPRSGIVIISDNGGKKIQSSGVIIWDTGGKKLAGR